MVYKFFDNETSGSGIKNENILNKELLKNYINLLLENLRKEKYIHLLLTILGVHNWHICS